MNPKKRSKILIIVAVAFLGISLMFLVSSFFVGSNNVFTVKEWKDMVELNKSELKKNPKQITIITPTSLFRGVWATVTILDGQSQGKYSVFISNVDKFSKEYNGESDALNWDNFNSASRFSVSVVSVLLAPIFSLLPILLLILFYFFFFMRSGAMGPSSKFSATIPKKSKTLFSDIAGIIEEKKELMEVVEFLKTPQKFIEMGARIPKGVLLVGPPGTGKTLLAKAVSGEAKVPFFSATGSSFEEVYVGLGASRIRQIFKKAKEMAPSIIFIDEIDSLGDARGGMSSYKNQTLNQFLSEMDGFEPNNGVIVIAATNRGEVLDPAMIRSGRFDRKIQLTLPDVRERELILKIHARNKKISKSVSFEEIAERTPGFSGAQLENSLNESALVAVRRKQSVITSEDIDEGIDRIIGGPAKKSRIISPETKLVVSIHEAGHALIGLVLANAFTVQKVTIIPRGKAGGYTISTPKNESLIMSKESILHQITGFMGGRAAEQIQFGVFGVTTGAYDDFSKASELAKRMVREFGMSAAGLRFLHSPQMSYFPPENLSDKSKEKTDEEINKILNLCFEWAKNLIIKNKKLLDLIAESLLILETITLNDIRHIHKTLTLPATAATKKSNHPDKKYFDPSIIKKKNSLNIPLQ